VADAVDVLGVERAAAIQRLLDNMPAPAPAPAPAAAAEPEEESDDDGSLEGWTVAELKDALDEAGVDYPANARKAELIELLESEG
jgi:uncharacterized protein YfaP (DUF2135 family)